jgi:hypothetical protein
MLAELDPGEIITGDQPDDTLALASQLAGVKAELAEASAFMDAHGFNQRIGNRLNDLEAWERELTRRLSEAKEKADYPLSAAWGDAQTLIGALDNAPAPGG